jgi:hypothetical protein
MLEIVALSIAKISQKARARSTAEECVLTSSHTTGRTSRRRTMPMPAAAPAAPAHDHDHGAGNRCSSWVDDALDAAGDTDAPRPGSCCDKDEKDRAEARRLRAIVTKADPVRRAMAVRAASNPASVVVMPPLPERAAGNDEDSDDLLTDEEEDDFEDARMTADPALREIQERRIREMKAAQARSAAESAHAGYVASRETDLPGLIKDGPSRLVAHFTLDGSEESTRIDEALDALAPAHPRTRFVRIRSGLPSPTLAALGATSLPALVTFRRRALGRWTAG